MKVYPCGYAVHGNQIAQLMQEHPQLVMIDTRFKPWSNRPAWRQETLKATYGDRYRWGGKSLGNLNYKSGGPIRLADPVAGLRGLRHWLTHGYDLLLLCGCAVFEQCHLSTIVSLLKSEVPEIEVFRSEQRAREDCVKCLSVRQPWASLIVSGMKDIENRDWTTHYRGLLLIHAGSRFDPYAFDWILPQLTPDERKVFSLKRADYPLGALVGIVRFTDVLTSSESRWFTGPYGWQFTQARPLPEPIPLKGQLGLFDTHPEIEKQVRAALERRVSA